MAGPAGLAVAGALGLVGAGLAAGGLAAGAAISAGGGALGAMAGNAIDPCHHMSPAAAALGAGLGFGLGAGLAAALGRGGSAAAGATGKGLPAAAEDAAAAAADDAASIAGSEAASAGGAGDDVIQETLTRSGDITSQHTLTADEALAAGEKFLDGSYRELGKPGSGVFRNDATGNQFRMDNNSLMGNHAPGVPHVHFESYAPGASKPFVNNHVPIH